MKKLRIARVVDDSVVDGPGVRYTIFTQGCSHGCKGCHNKHTHSYSGGKEITVEELLADISLNKYIRGITFSGGEPLDQPEPLGIAIRVLKQAGYHIIVYSGYTLEQITKDDMKLASISSADILIDGKYDESLRSLDLLYRGSSNQRILDIKKSLEEERAVEVDF